MSREHAKIAGFLSVLTLAILGAASTSRAEPAVPQGQAHLGPCFLKAGGLGYNAENGGCVQGGGGCRVN